MFQKMYGQYLMRHAFNYCRLAELGGDNTMTTAKASDTGLTYIAEAIKLFEEVKMKYRIKWTNLKNIFDTIDNKTIFKCSITGP